MKQLTLYRADQETQYRYIGFAAFRELADMLEGYPFEDDVLEKAAIHKENFLDYGNANDTTSIPSINATLRVSPDAEKESDGDTLKITFEDFNIVDGRSKLAALTLLDAEWLDNNYVKINLFILDKESMDRLYA